MPAARYRAQGTHLAQDSSLTKTWPPASCPPAGDAAMVRLLCCPVRCARLALCIVQQAHLVQVAFSQGSCSGQGSCLSLVVCCPLPTQLRQQRTQCLEVGCLHPL